jgi:hypothetical protein
MKEEMVRKEGMQDELLVPSNGGVYLRHGTNDIN